MAFNERAVDICDSPVLLGSSKIVKEEAKEQEEQGGEAVHSVAGCRGSLDEWRRMGLGFGEAWSRAWGGDQWLGDLVDRTIKVCKEKWGAIMREVLAHRFRW